ncbi:MAG: hypothetical protein LBC50_01265 [Candidatus Ancillula sp.]|jgi:NitT/TauT family transport system substrate-binding protein|nr:hypothetical protein [Candidatus Ancillula sp.]
MKKKLLIIIPLIVVIVLASVIILAKTLTQKQEAAKDAWHQVSVVVPDGAPLLPFAQFATSDDFTFNDGVLQLDDAFKEQLSKDVSVRVVSGPDQLASSLKQNMPDLAVVPVNLAAKLYNDADPKYQVVSVVTWGMNEIVGQAPVSNLSDLVGSTIYSFGKAETPGITLRTLLGESGVPYVDATWDTPVDGAKVNIIDLATAQDIMAALPGSDPDKTFGLLPEPVATAFTAKNNAFSVGINLQDVWKNVFDTPEYPQAVLVANSDFLNQEGNAKFTEDFNSVLTLGEILATEDPETAVNVLSTKLNSTMFSAVNPGILAIKSKRLDIHNQPVFVSGGEGNSNESGQEAVMKYLEIIKDFSSDSAKLIGGEIPGEDFWAELK